MSNETNDVNMYLRPRRGKRSTAETQNFVLKKGEIFFESPETGTGTGVGRIKIGDGITAYTDLPYFTEDLGELLESKMDKENPTGEGTFNLNRKPDTTIGQYSSTMGYINEASGNYSVALGKWCTASGESSVVLGNSCTGSGESSVVLGNSCTGSGGESSVALGKWCTASGNNSVAIGYNCRSLGNYSVSIGYACESSNSNSYAEGNGTKASGSDSHAEGNLTKATGTCSHAEGKETQATAEYTHAEGEYSKAIQYRSHAEGFKTTASGTESHAEGNTTTASGSYSHSEGLETKATGGPSHAEGTRTTASGNASHAEGYGTIASGANSHTEGYYTTAAGEYQHVQGKYNVEDTEKKYAHIVGGGKYNNPKNIHTIDWAGNSEYSGDVKANACGGETPVSLIETANSLASKADSDHNHDDIYYGKSFINDSFNNLITVEKIKLVEDNVSEAGGVVSQLITIDANAKYDVPDISCEKFGKTPIAIAGFYLNSNYFFISKCHITNNTIKITIRNASNEAKELTSDSFVNVLYVGYSIPKV